jgi:hypothetical protein
MKTTLMSTVMISAAAVMAVAQSITSNTAIVGGYDDNSPTGPTWVTRSGGVWTQQGAKPVGSGTVGNPIYQGSSVALSADGNTAIMGGNADNNFAEATWVFTRSRAIWTQQGAKLVGSDTGGNPIYRRRQPWAGMLTTTSPKPHGSSPAAAESGPSRDQAS